MSDDTLHDLRQFIGTTIAQATACLARDLAVARIEANHYYRTLDRHFEELELKLATIADAHAIILEDHEFAIEHLQTHVSNNL